MRASDLLAVYLLGFIAVHFVFRMLLSAAGITDQPLAGRLRSARLHPWRGPALLAVIGGSLILQLVRAPIWIGEVTVFPAFGVIWLVSELTAARWLREQEAATSVRVVHAARLVAYLVAIVGLGIANHLVVYGESATWIMAGVGAAMAAAIIVSWVTIRRREHDSVSAAVRGALGRIEQEGNDSSELADRVEQLAEAGKVDEAAQMGAPLFDEAIGPEPGWGVKNAACRAAMALAIAHARGGNRAGVGTALGVLERLAQERMDPIAGITAQTGLADVVDAMLAAGYVTEAARAVDVRAAMSRRTGLPAGADDVVCVIAALVNAGVRQGARTLHQRHVVGREPPIAIDPALVARMQEP